MQRYKRYLEALGDVVTFDYPYMAAGRRTPDPFPKLLEAHRAALALAQKDRKRAPILIGKSLGSRVGCHLSLSEQAEKLVCLGYPLKAPGASGKLRDQVLRELRTPILFVQGTRDPLCPLDVLSNVRGQMQAENELFVVETGDHSLAVTKTYSKTSGKSQDAIDLEVLGTIERFIR